MMMESGRTTEAYFVGPDDTTTIDAPAAVMKALAQRGLAAVMPDDHHIRRSSLRQQSLHRRPLC
jgi:hypothetical protein